MSASIATLLPRSAVAILAICSAAGLPLWLASSSHRMADAPPQMDRIEPRPTADAAPSAIDLSAMLARSQTAADNRNQAALTLATSEINAILDRQFADLYFQAESTAEAIATYQNCVRVIGLLASDTVRGRTDARKWVKKRVEGRLQPQILDCQREVQAVLERFDRELRASTLTLATQLAAVGSAGSLTNELHHPEGLDSLSLEEALQKLGFGGSLLTPAIVLDLYGLMHSQIISWMITKAVDMAKWIFARPLAAAVAEAGLVVADGPLPIGDAIAALGAAWTAYDIYALRGEFEKELTAAVRKTLPGARRDMQHQIWAALRQRMAEHAELQAKIHDETARDLLP